MDIYQQRKDFQKVILKIGIRMVKETFKTTSFSWGKNYTEFFIDSEDIKVNNREQGLPKTSLFLENAEYEVIISDKEKVISKITSLSKGIAELSGTEKENLFLEKYQKSKKHIRYYTLSNEELNFNFSKNFLELNDFLDKELFIYLIKKEES